MGSVPWVRTGWLVSSMTTLRRVSPTSPAMCSGPSTSSSPSSSSSAFSAPEWSTLITGSSERLMSSGSSSGTHSPRPYFWSSANITIFIFIYTSTLSTFSERVCGGSTLTTTRCSPRPSPSSSSCTPPRGPAGGGSSSPRTSSRRTPASTTGGTSIRDTSACCSPSSGTRKTPGGSRKNQEKV